MLTLKHLLDPEIKMILITDNKILLYPDTYFLPEVLAIHKYVLLRNDLRNDDRWNVYERNNSFIFTRDHYQDLIDMVNGRTKTRFNWKKEGF